RPAEGNDFGTMSRIPVARSIGIGAELREESCRRDSRQRTRLVEAVFSGDQRLVRVEQLLFVVVQLRVVVDLPPRAFGNRVLGRGDAPRTFGLVVGRRLHWWTMIVWSHHASGQQTGGDDAGRERQALHDCWPPWFAGATFTC